MPHLRGGGERGLTGASVCTILLGLAPDTDTPVLLAANRDEFLDRPAREPAEIAPGVFAGCDLQAGGTWLAVGRTGIAALTNVRDRPLDPAAPSRGQLPLRALAGSLPRDLAAFNAFNLLVVDTDGARVVTHLGPGQRTYATALGPGSHAIVNDPFGEPSLRAECAAALLAAGGFEVATLAQHATADAPGLCHHFPGYGTRSATIVALGRDGRLTRYLHCPGPPCRTPGVDLTGAARAVVVEA